MHIWVYIYMQIPADNNSVVGMFMASGLTPLFWISNKGASLRERVNFSPALTSCLWLCLLILPGEYKTTTTILSKFESSFN